MAPANIDGEPLSKSAHLPGSKALIKPEDLEPVEPGSSLKTLRTLRRPTVVPDHFITSSSLIGSVKDGLHTSGKSEDTKSGKHVVRHGHTHSHIMLHVSHENNRQTNCSVTIWHFARPLKTQQVGFVGGNIELLQPKYAHYQKGSRVEKKQRTATCRCDLTWKYLYNDANHCCGKKWLY